MPKVALRDRQAELTRDLILEALAALIGEGRLSEFSVQEVADRAGVSLRTVYRHFASRQALLDGYVEWGWRRVEATAEMALPVRAADISAMVRVTFAALEQLAPIALPLFKLDAAAGLRREGSAKRLEAIRSALAEVTGELDPEMAEAVVWTIRMICARKTYADISQGGVDAAHAGAAAAWAVDVLIESLREGRGPTLEEGAGR